MHNRTLQALPAATTPRYRHEKGQFHSTRWQAASGPHVARPVSPATADAGPGDWPHGWQMQQRELPKRNKTHIGERKSTQFPDGKRVFGSLPSHQSQQPFPPPALQMALRCRQRQPFPVHSNICGPPHGCGGAADRFSDHALARPVAGFLARWAVIVELAWVQVAREAMGAEGQVIRLPFRP